MLSLIAVLAILSAAALLAAYLIRQAQKPVDKTLPPPPMPLYEAGTLFAPSPDELKALERARRDEIAAAAASDRHRQAAGQAAEIERRISDLVSSPLKQNAIDVIRLAAEQADAALFSRASHEILKVFREDRLQGLTANDLAALLDSHYRLLPPRARSSGELFWLKEEIAAVRLMSVDKNG